MPAADADPKEVKRLQALALMVLAQSEMAPDASKNYWLQAEKKLTPLLAGSRDPEVLEPWIRIAIALDSRPFPDQSLSLLREAGYARPGFVAMLRKAGIAYELRAPAMASSSIAGLDQAGNNREKKDEH
jgi:hypothetical protein